MQLTADQELRRELLLFSLSKHSDLEAAIKIAAEMEQFVLRGSGADGCAGARPAEVMVNAAQSGEGFLPDGQAVPRDLLYHKMNRSEEHTSELQSLMRISYAVFSLKK